MYHRFARGGVPSGNTLQVFVPVLQARVNYPHAFKRANWLTHMGLAGATIGTLCLMVFGGHGPGGAAVATTRQPPVMGPEYGILRLVPPLVSGHYNVASEHQHRITTEAPASVLQLRGAAR